MSEVGETLRKSLGLSKAEFRVFRLVGAGMSNDAVAKKLFVSLNTVRSHMKSIYKRIGRSNRGDIIAMWLTFLATVGKEEEV